METDLDRLALGIASELRAFVREAGRRRALPLTAYVGVPGVLPHALVQPDPSPDLDVVSRADLVERAVDGLPRRSLELHRACAWTTRPGEADPSPGDLVWHSAAQEGFGRHGLELPAFFVIGRYGWLELSSGRSRQWRRVRSYRQRSERSAGPWRE